MTYEYLCTACGHAWEAEQSISAAPLKTCPNCHEEAAKRQVSGGAGFILKGGGWYADLYSSASKPSADAKPSDTKPSADTTTKTDAGTKADKGSSGSSGTSGSGSTGTPTSSTPTSSTPSGSKATGAASGA